MRQPAQATIQEGSVRSRARHRSILFPLGPPQQLANHSQKGPGDRSEIPSSEPRKHADVNATEQGEPRT
jgi:hypothetical protein